MARHAPAQNNSDDESDSSGNSDHEEQVAAPPAKLLQHMFLQILLSRRSITDPVARLIYAKCAKLAGVGHPDSLTSFVSELEGPLGNCGLAVKQKLDQQTKVLTWTLINEFSDEPAKLATEYSPIEIAYFRLIVKRIMTATNMAYAVKQKDAIYLAKKLKPPMSQTNGQDLLTNFVAKGWLYLSETSRLTLSHRALVELWKYLKETYSDDDDVAPHDRSYVPCMSCGDLVTVGWACPSETCPVRVHDKCAHGFLSPSKGVCIGDRDDDTTDDCNTRWDKDNKGNYVGLQVGLGDSQEPFSLADNEAAGESEEDGLDDSQEQQSQKKGKKAALAKGKAAAGKKGKMVARDDDEDEEVDEEQEEEEEDDDDDDIDGLQDALTQGGLLPKRNSRAKPAAKQEVDSDDDMDE